MSYYLSSLPSITNDLNTSLLSLAYFLQSLDVIIFYGKVVLALLLQFAIYFLHIYLQAAIRAIFIIIRLFVLRRVDIRCIYQTHHFANNNQ